MKVILNGIDATKYESIKLDINRSNKRLLTVLSFFTTVAMLVLGILSLLIPGVFLKPAFYFVSASIFVVITIWSLIFKAGPSNSITYGCMLYMLAILSVGMFFGLYDAPDKTSTVFIALLMSVPLLFTVRPVITDLIIIFVTFLFVFTESNVKDSSVYYVDAINGITFAIVSMCVSTYFMRTKLLKLYSDLENKRLIDIVHQESIVDDMTGLGNRKGYEDNFNKYPYVSSGRDFVYVSIDLNGLKVANDTLGHAAGDELIKGAADCMKAVFSRYGNLYRVGGDEFVAALFVDDELFESLKQSFINEVEGWKGEIVDELSVAIGYASAKANPGVSVAELSKIADKLMYADKGRYYKQKGVDRRGRQEAHSALISLCDKILKIDLNEDIFQLIKYDENELNEENGYSDTISGWFKNFALKGQVHPEDVENFLKSTDLDYIKQEIASGKAELAIYYRRKINGSYKKVVMEIIPVDTYSEYNKQAFLFVKQIER